MTHLHDSNEEIQSYINNLLLIEPVNERAYLDASGLNQNKHNGDQFVAAELALKVGVEKIDENLVKVGGNTGEVSKEETSSAFIKHIEILQQRKQAIIAKQEAIPFDSRPVWGQSEFTCLSFNVSGLKLAIAKEFILDMQPLNLVKSLADSQTSKYFLGSIDLQSEESATAKVIDTAQMVMPERYKIEMRENYRYMLRLKDCDWCLAVDSVGGDFNLSPQKVRWRSEHTRREWLAGTIIDKMCALIDVDALNRQFMATIVLDD